MNQCSRISSLQESVGLELGREDRAHDGYVGLVRMVSSVAETTLRWMRSPERGCGVVPIFNGQIGPRSTRKTGGGEVNTSKRRKGSIQIIIFHN